MRVYQKLSCRARFISGSGTVERKQDEGISRRHLPFRPPNMPHYGWGKDGEVILQVTGVGPSGSIPIPQKQ